MLANSPIYRRDETGYEYNIVYSPETIKLMSEKMLRDNTFNNIDIQHNGEILSKGMVNLVEVFIKNEDKGIAPNFLKNIPDGSLIGSYKINDDVLWNMCKEGSLHGFSLAGFFNVAQIDKKKSKYSMIKKIKEKLSELLVELSAEEETETVEQVTETEEVKETVEETEAPAESEEKKEEVPAESEEKKEEVPAESEEVQMAAETEEKKEEVSDTEEAPAESEETKEEVPAETEDNSEIALIKADIASMKNDIELAKGLYEQMKTDLESIKETLQNLVNAPAVPPVTE